MKSGRRAISTIADISLHCQAVSQLPYLYECLWRQSIESQEKVPWYRLKTESLPVEDVVFLLYVASRFNFTVVLIGLMYLIQCCYFG